MQAASRRGAIDRKGETVRTFTQLPGPKGFATPPQKFPKRTQQITEEGSVASGGAFYSMYDDGSGDIYLQGGSVTGGNGGTATIADYKVIDAGTGPTAAAGTILYMRAACTATVADGIMLPGCLLTGGSTSLQTGSSIPDNHTFTTTLDNGYIYTEIGRWTADDFLPSAPGNLLADGCIGSFQLTR
jgi:hypothetical protein